MPFVELHSDAVHFGSIGKIVLLAGSVSDTSRSLLTLTPLLFSGKAVGSGIRAATAGTAAVRNIDIAHTSGIGDSRLRDVIFLTQELVSLIQLPLLRDIGIIGRARSVQRLACRSHLVSVGSNIDDASGSRIGRVRIGNVILLLASTVPISHGSVVSTLVSVHFRL